MKLNLNLLPLSVFKSQSFRFTTNFLPSILKYFGTEVVWCLAMRQITVPVLIICCIIAQVFAQNDSLDQIFDDIQEDDVNLDNLLEILSEQIIDTEQSAIQSYPKILLTHRFQSTIEKNHAISDHIFIGSSFESYTRFRVGISKNISAGVLIQKDVGEQNFFDHYTAFISWKHPTHPYKITLGNYYIGCAEGLLLSGPFSLPASAIVKKPSSKKYLESRPFLSSNEYDGFWGGVIEIGDINSLKLITFYSQISRDGIFDKDDYRVTGFDRTGYHRTFSEKNKANRIVEKTSGGMISFPFILVDKLGIAYLRTHYSPNITKAQSSDERRKNYFNFYGSLTENYSFFYMKAFSTLHLSGEIVPLKSQKISHITTLNFTVPKWQFIIKTWHIPPQFQSPHGRIPSDSGPFPKSVQGFIFAAAGNPLNNLKFSAYWSHKNDLWRSYFQPLPVQKKEFYLQNEYRFGVKNFITIRFHVSSSNVYSSEKEGKTNIIKQRVRIHFSRQFKTKVRIQTRFEKVFLNSFPYQDSKNGINIYQDLSWYISKKLTLQIRFSAFETNDYDSRIYEYENDLPNVFSNYPLYGRGSKWYIMVTFKPVPKIKLWLKYHRIIFDGVNAIGSGLTQINGNMRQDIHIQLEIRY